jgi:hypothetical protein
MGILAMFTFTAGWFPSMQLCCAAYHVFESCRDVDHFIAVAFCKANAGFSSGGGQSNPRSFGIMFQPLLKRFGWRDNTDNG